MDKLEKILRKYLNNGSDRIDVTMVLALIQQCKKDTKEQLILSGVIERYSGENLMKLQKHFVSIYGSDEMAQEKANSFAVGFGKSCELIIKDLNAL